MTTFSDRFLVLFRGRMNAYGEDKWAVREPVTRQLINEHLAGTRTIGIYPAVDNHVRWGCIDLDVKSDNHPTYDFETSEEAENTADDLVTAFAAKQIHSIKERTKSNGWHVWIFAKQWVPCFTMRNALTAACLVAGAPTRELNPKNTRPLDSKELGNFVRLPTPQRIPLEQLTEIIETAYDERATLKEIEHLASYAPQRIKPDLQAINPNSSLKGVYDPLVKTIYAGGPLDGMDRSSYLFHLAKKAYERGVSANDIARLLRGADELHGRKYCDRPDAEQRYEDIIRKVAL